MSANLQNQQSQFKQACEYINSGQPQLASEVLEQIVSDGHAWDEVYSKLGVSYIIQGRRRDAIDAFIKAIDANDKFAPAYSNLCLAYHEEQEFEKAIEIGEKGLDVDRFYTPLYNSLVLPLKFFGRFDEALQVMQKGVSLHPENIQLRENLAKLYYENGQKEEMLQLCNAILRDDHGNIAAHTLIAITEGYDADAPKIGFLEELCERGDIAPAQKINLYFVLGKVYEGCKDFQRSAEWYKKANEAFRASYLYLPSQDAQFFSDIKSVFSKDFVERNVLEECCPAPIFIVGMPRSGTSLVEQILASHSQVYGAGELGELERVQFKDAGVSKEKYAEGVGALGAEDFENMAESYALKLSQISDGERFVTDKMPTNFRHIGLIKTLFPNAKIIHCVRDPCDTALSIFKQYFPGDMPFAHSEADIVHYYKLYEDIMAHWQEMFSGQIYDLNYEGLTEKPRETIVELFDYCGLNWEEACMSFHNTKRAVATASAMQVRKPIYKGAVGYWKNYAPYFQDFFGGV